MKFWFLHEILSQENKKFDVYCALLAVIDAFTENQRTTRTFLDQRGALEGRCVSSKSLSRVQGGDKGVAGRKGREKCLPNDSMTF